MSPEDPFTSVKWDRHEEAEGSNAGFNSATPSFVPFQNTPPSEQVSDHFDSQGAPAPEPPQSPGSPDMYDRAEASESSIQATAQESALSTQETVSSHASGVKVPGPPAEAGNGVTRSSEVVHEGKPQAENTLNSELAVGSGDPVSAHVVSDGASTHVVPDGASTHIVSDGASTNAASEPANTYTDGSALENTSDYGPGADRAEEYTAGPSVQSKREQGVLEEGALARASHDTPNAEKEAEFRQIEAFQKMADRYAQYDISSRVSEPLSDRDGNSKAFISYLVVTKTNHPDVLRLQPKAAESGFATVKVRRRYGDFRFLHDCLMADFPQLLVPPLPAKSNFKYLKGDTFSTSFVHKRLHSLDRFITYICQHKLLSQSSVFHYFISDSAEWTTFTQNLKILKNEDSESSIVGKVVNEELLTETVMNFFTSSKHKRETNKDILEISEKLKKLYENLIKLDRIFSRLNKKNNDLKTDYEAFSQQINKLAALNESSKSLDTDAESASSTRAAAAENDPAANADTPVHAAVSKVTTNFRLFSDSLVYFSENWSKLYKHVDESFLVALKDCSKYIIRLTNLIELQHNKKIDLQVLQDYLSKARVDLANLSGTAPSAHQPQQSAPNPALIGQYSGGIVNNTAQLIKDTISTSATPHIGSSQSDNKKWKLQNRISQLEGEISAQTCLVNDLTSRIINEEYPNWDEFNKAQLKRAMTELCDEKIAFYKRMMENWSEVEIKLMKRLEELE